MASKKRDPKERLSPTATVSHLTDDLMADMGIPPPPENIPQRLAEAIQRRVLALLYQLREAQRREYIKALEVRLVRDAYRAVLTAFELGVPDCEIYYATFRQHVEALGYESVEVGFRKPG